MPVKFKPTTKVRKRGGGIETVHYYMHQTDTKELLQYLESASSKPKVRQKVRNELTKRGVSFENASG
tara:strand:- start:52 stop:252 length:201 start_codon:yes stop_codon:yes gene_type:complete